MPSISPSPEAGAPRAVVTRLAISPVGMSWPTSARKLAEPMPTTPRVIHGGSGAGAALGFGAVVVLTLFGHGVTLANVLSSYQRSSVVR